MPKQLTCRICGKPRQLGQLKCQKCSQKQFAKRQRELVKKQKKKEQKENNPRRLKLHCDSLWRENIKHNYPACVICGKTDINIHHIISRANKAVRWYRGNGIALCALHHTFGTKSAHQDPLWFREIMIGLRGKSWEKDLMLESNKTWPKDFEKVKKYLNWEIDSYNL